MENPGLNLEVYENVFTSPDIIFEKLEREIVYLPENQSSICNKGKVCRFPRQLVAFGDPSLSYSFSGCTVSSQPWTPLLLEIRKVVEEISGCSYNFVLINRYKDGNDYIGQHKDNELDLVKDYPICSVSFGEERKMIFKRPFFKDYCLELKNNSMTVMKSPTNQLWSHGIPRQPKRNGVRVNLTFRKMILCNKRKSEETVLETNKRGKKDSKGAVFTEDEIPDDFFQIGDSTFVYPCTFRGKVLVHIRRFKKYGKTFYPTSEGVTLHPRGAEHIMNRDALPQTRHDLKESIFLPEEEIEINTTDFDNFTFTQYKTTQGGDALSTSIIITSSQWTKMMKLYKDIVVSVLDYVYGSMDFLSAYMSFEERDISASLPNCLDVSLGLGCLLDLLRKTLSDCIKTNGGLRDPEILAEELWANRIETFNSAAFTVDVHELADYFYHRLWENKDFLLLSKPALYISTKFLKDIRLQDVLRDVRKELCPANTYEYFEDVENSVDLKSQIVNNKHH